MVIMKLSERLKSFFDSDVRSRGASYYLNHAVRSANGGPNYVAAEVLGSEIYDASLILEGSELRAYCTCPYFADRGEGCKHLWATVLNAEHNRYLTDLERLSLFDLVWFDEVGDDGFEDDDDYDYLPPEKPRHYAPVVAPKRAKKPKKEHAPAWSEVLKKLQNAGRPTHQPRANWPADRRLIYVIDAAQSRLRNEIHLELGYQDLKKDGNWAKPKLQSFSQAQAEQAKDPHDAAIVPILFGTQQAHSYSYTHAYGTPQFHLSPARCAAILPAIGRTARLYIREGRYSAEPTPLEWDDGPAWQLWLEVTKDPKGKRYHVGGVFKRGEERRGVTEPQHIFSAGLVVWQNGAIGLADLAGGSAWIPVLSKQPLAVSIEHIDAFLGELTRMAARPPIALPEELKVDEVRTAPKPRIVIRAHTGRNEWRTDTLEADVSFEYAGQRIEHRNSDKGVYDAAERRFYVRDPEAEDAHVAMLARLGFRSSNQFGATEYDFELTARYLPKTTLALLKAGWLVEAEGKLYRQSGSIKIDVSSGVDWFDLEGNVQFDDQYVPLPRLLQALKRGENTIQLDDGTFGMLPADWLKKYGMLTGLGTADGDKLRFSRSQTGILDALLASMPDVSADATFRQAAEELRRFDGIQAVSPPEEFVGTLREYQREGLGWLRFLERFGFGGCLADDMGLGKTVQVLAHLAGRKVEQKKKKARPTLVVVPRSLVFNWSQEAKRFAPHLTVVDHSQPDRAKDAGAFADADLVITTYGILRRDVLLFRDASFDYCILDEAQTVKNADTDQAKAVRLLQANHRLAMSGTPIENHLGELWSLFEFLNPGMLGHASIFKLAGGAARNPEPETRAILAKGLRPFILRRTKQQVAKDLPDKTEQTLYCQLEPEQRKLYNELRDHYRQSLAKTIASVGMNRAKIQVLEALLRLRQAACHPGLIDKRKSDDASAKTEMLMPYLKEAWEEGQKTLVFSQFTSFLAILRGMLDREGMTYEYLDGKTRKRQDKVEHFQNDPDCKLFLISLKAGGVGLNLTAAEYVFLLDPWWNPAVEAQAIDRTHRIGQTKPVFAYRLIARDTVEEKVLELQKTKRDLADAILNAENSPISNLSREDLEMLLS